MGLRSRWAVAAALLGAAGLACSSSEGPPPEPDAGHVATPEECRAFIDGYEIAALEARRCDPDDPSPCGGRAPESLETQCIVGVAPGLEAQLNGFVAQFQAMGCVVSPPPPCPEPGAFRCEQDPNGFGCVPSGP
jgi:hypothetical protein